jgi:hypothetical protein
MKLPRRKFLGLAAGAAALQPYRRGKLQRQPGKVHTPPLVGGFQCPEFTPFLQ